MSLRRFSWVGVGEFVRNCCGVTGSEMAEAILWLFWLSKIRLERKKECYAIQTRLC